MTTLLKFLVATLASRGRGPAPLTLVAGYLLATALISIPYMRWRAKSRGALRQEK